LLISPLSPSHPHAIACRCPCVPNLTVDPITPAPCRRHSSSPAPVLPLRPRRHPKCHVPSQLKRIEITFVSMVHDISNVNALFLEGLLVNDMRIDYVIKGKWLAKLWQRQKEMILPPSHIKVQSKLLQKNPTKNAILENRSNHLPSLVITFDLHGKTYCIWLTNEGIRVFSFLH
jgi:hypothetical protein